MHSTGSVVPQASLSSYLTPGPTGFITADYNKFKAATGYYALNNSTIDAATRAFRAGTGIGFPLQASSGKADEKTLGLYAEVNGILNLGHELKYNLGLRWVETHQAMTSLVTHVDPRNATQASPNLYPDTYTLATTRQNYSAFLPSLSAVYEVSDDFKLRASVSRSMTRPDFTSIIGGVSFIVADAASASLSNPDLKPYYSNNIDLGAELYTGGEGYIGFTAFRKGIAGFTSSVNVTQPFSYLAQYGITYGTITGQQQQAIDARGGPTVAKIVVTQQVNQSGIMTINGLEFDYVQPLDFLLEPYGLKGFGVTGNVTLLDQRSSGSAPVFAQAVAPYGYNVTGYYENDGLMLRVSYVFTDRTYNSASNTLNVCLPSTQSLAAGCPQGAYLFGAPYAQMDFSSSVKLAKFFGELPSDPEVTFDVQNVLHAKLVTYDQFKNAVNTYYDPGSVFLFGIRGRF